MNKKQILRLIAVFFLILIASQIGIGQVNNSVYSMFGVGQISDYSYGINQSLGGTGIAFQSDKWINYANPASYLGLSPSSYNLELGVYGIFSQAENATTRQNAGNGNFSYCSWSFSFTNRWAAILGIVPYSSVDYQITSADQIEGELISFEKQYTGSGGLSKVYVGNSFGITKGLAIGMNTAFILGHIEQRETALSEDSFSGYQLQNTRSAHSFHMDFGLQYSVFKNDWKYTLGAIYIPGKKLSTTDEIEFTYDDETTILEQDQQLASLRIPEKRGFGLAVKKGNTFKAGMDYEWQNWSTVHFSNPNLDTRNSDRFSFGLEYAPGERKKPGESFIYRLGAHYKKSYLEIDNTQINAMGIVLGLGIPNFNTIRNHFNISLAYGREGTLDRGLIRNQYLTLNFGLSLHEFYGYGR